MAKRKSQQAPKKSASPHQRLKLAHIGEIARATAFPKDLVSSKREFVLVYVVRLFFLVGRRLWRDQMPFHAAALSYQTLLSLIPLFAVAVGLATAFGFSWYDKEIVVFLEQHLLPDAAQDVGDWILRVIDGIRPMPLTSIGGLTLFVLAVMLLTNLERAMNSIFRCKKQRNFLERAMRTTAVLAVAPPALGFSIYLTRKFVLLPDVLSAVWPLLFTMGALFLGYTLLPRRKVRIRHSLIAAFIAGIGFELLKFGFAFYARRFGVTYNNLYGAFAMIPIFLIWVYATWLLFLFGAELSAALHEVPDRERLERR